MQDFRRLRVWEQAHQLAVHTLREVGRAPRANTALRHQLTRSVASVAANIAEGASQRSRAKYAHFLSVALGSLVESHNHVLLLSAIGGIDESVADRLIGRIEQLRPMLIRLEQIVSAEARGTGVVPHGPRPMAHGAAPQSTRLTTGARDGREP